MFSRICLACFALLLPVSVLAQERQPPTPSVVAHGEAVIRRAPDRAFVDLAVETRAKTPKEARARNAEIMVKVQEAVKQLGIPADAVQTRAYELHPEFDYVNGRQVPRGYTARNRIEVRVDQLDQLGEVIDGAIGAGATNAGSIRFDLKDRSGVEREALKRAVADARARADAAAAGAGLTIARVLRIEEGSRLDQPPPMPMVAGMREMKADAPTPIAAGEIEIRVAVTLTAELK